MYASKRIFEVKLVLLHTLWKNAGVLNFKRKSVIIQTFNFQYFYRLNKYKYDANSF